MKLWKTLNIFEIKTRDLKSNSQKHASFGDGTSSFKDR